ncbi:MAG TPA: DnaB-like helicase C-terminal domain-containing protein, partial [Planctomycetaceae bacterium]|nr:DnaB-like helicase C-terminal domain-containing protein [Planctomycetaceae bacterium]
MREDTPYLPPQNLVAEQSVLASMMLAVEAILAVAAILKPRQFYASAHQLICDVIFALNDAGEPADAVTVAEELSRRQQLAEIGGGQYLAEVLEAVPHAGNAVHYAEIVRQCWRERSLIVAFTDGIRDVRDRSKEWIAITADAEHQLHALMESEVAAGPTPIRDVLVEAMAGMAAGRGTQTTIPTRFARLDQLSGGIPSGRVTVVAGRTSHGKTALVCSIVTRLVNAGVPTMLVSYEQPKLELAARFISIVSRVPLTVIQRGQFSGSDAHAVHEACEHLGTLPLLVDDSCPDEATLSATIRLQVRRSGIQVIVVDYLQLVEARDRKAPREQQVAGVSRALNKLALQTGAAVVLLSQLNRGVEAREIKRPRLSDLRESGAIEQDANQVWLMHRPHKDSDKADEIDDHAVIEIAKNRNGPCGSFHLQWNPGC